MRPPMIMAELSEAAYEALDVARLHLKLVFDGWRFEDEGTVPKYAAHSLVV